MKKLLKLSLIIISIILLLLQNYCYATDNITNEINPTEAEGEGIPADWARSVDQNASHEDMLIDGAFENLYSEENGIMPINEEAGYTSNLIDEDIYLCEQNVSIEEDVSGNIYVIGKKINISSGYINGNVFVIGQDVTINGLITGSIYVLGENIKIGTSGVNTVYAIGQNVALEANSNIMCDLKVSAESLNVAGNINRNLEAYVENINIDPASEYIAKGEVSYSKELADPNGILAQVNVKQHEENEKTIEQVKKFVIAERVKSEIITVISTAIIIAVIYLIVKNNKTEKVENYSQEIGNNILKGFLGLILVPTIAIMLLFTIIGIPLSILLITIYIVALFVSIPVASLRIGEIVYNIKPINSNKAFTILYAVCAYIVIKVVSFVPVIGGLIKFLVLLYGLGNLIKYIKPSKKQEMKKEDVEVISEENN